MAQYFFIAIASMSLDQNELFNHLLKVIIIS